MGINFLKAGKTNKPAYFFYRFFILFLVLAFIDLVAGNMLTHFYFKINHDENYRTTYVIERAREQILIIGSSRATHHYNPDAIGDSLKMSCYNAGRDGNFIFYYYAVLQSVVKRYKPQMIILDIAAEDIEVKSDSYDKISTLLPYYKNHPEIRSIIELKSPFEKYKLISRIYPYNSNLLRIVLGNLDLRNKKNNELQEKGYIKAGSKWDRPLQLMSDSNDLDTIKTHYLRLFIECCRNEGINLCIFSSPTYLKSNQEWNYVGVIREMAAAYQVPFWDYSQDPYYLCHPALFSDVHHLNVEGAEVYSQQVINDVRFGKGSLSPK